MSDSNSIKSAVKNRGTIKIQGDSFNMDSSRVPPSFKPKGGCIKSVCYISNTGQPHPWGDGSTRYRCYYPVEYLRSRGVYAGLLPLRDFIREGAPKLPDADAYVFHRPTYSSIFAGIIKDLTSRGKLLVADYDDLIFGVENVKYSSQFEVSRDKLSLSALFGENTRALRLFDQVTVSTPKLAEMVLKAHPKAGVHVVRNGFPQKLLNRAWSIMQEKRLEKHVLGYFPGTSTHDGDFKTWQSDLVLALNDYDIQLRIVGPLAADVFKNIPSTSSRPGGSFYYMFDQMMEVSITLAPLQNNVFNASKSNIKAIEGFLVGCSALSTPLNDTVILKGQGFDISIIDGKNSFQSSMEELLVKPPISEKNAALVQEYYNLATVCAPLDQIFGL